MKDESHPKPEPFTKRQERDKPDHAAGGCLLYVAEGSESDRGRSLALTEGRVTVGTEDTCDLQLDDPEVSRTHAQLATVDEGILFVDLGSTNGTFYLGNKIDRAILTHGTHLRLGNTVITVLPLPEGSGIEPDGADHYGNLIGASIAMRRVYAVLRRLEDSDAPVLIQGETGTGKEVVARTLHEMGRRRNKPFVEFDCGSVPRELIDSEMFGHIKGAFTGANADRPGAFRSADTGTVFLDEIGELPLDLQPRLLRALDSSRVRRVGEDAYSPVNVRVIVATHRDLDAAVADRTFREDLFYRIAVVRIILPPLRERLEDIPLLARHLAKTIRSDAEPLPDEVINLMMGHSWPGNVRELRNVVHRLLTLGDLAQVPQSAPPTTTSGVNSSLPFKEAREQILGPFEAAYVGALIEKHAGNISAAARAAGIGRRQFRELMAKHGLK